MRNSELLAAQEAIAQATQGYPRAVPVTDLVPGDRIDLEADQYADPNHDNVFYEFEPSLVAGTELETHACFRVDFEGLASVGFPPEHRVRLMSHDDEYTA